MLTVPFFTAIAYEMQPIYLLENMIEVVDSYFYLGGNKAFVISAGDDGLREAVLREDSSYVILTALKIATYFTLILPFLALLTKATLRSCYTFLLQTKIKPKNPQEETPSRSSTPSLEEMADKEVDLHNEGSDELELTQTKIEPKNLQQETPPKSSTPSIEEVTDEEVALHDEGPDDLILTDKMIEILQEDLENGTTVYCHRKGHVSFFESIDIPKLTFLFGEGETTNDFTLGSIAIAKIGTLIKKAKLVCKKHHLDLIVIPKLKEFKAIVRGKEISFIALENLKLKREEAFQENLYNTLSGLEETKKQLEIFRKALGHISLSKKELPILDDAPEFKRRRRVAFYLESYPAAQKASPVSHHKQKS